MCNHPIPECSHNLCIYYCWFSQWAPYPYLDSIERPGGILRKHLIMSVGMKSRVYRPLSYLILLPVTAGCRGYCLWWGKVMGSLKYICSGEAIIALPILSLGTHTSGFILFYTRGRQHTWHECLYITTFKHDNISPLKRGTGLSV